jgi:fimbrial chaperone protein
MKQKMRRALCRSGPFMASRQECRGIGEIMTATAARRRSAPWKRWSRSARIGGAIAGLAILLTAISAAWAMAVSPVVVDLEPAGRRASQVVTVENRYARPITLEMRVQRAEYTDDGVRGTGEASDDLVVFPPQAIIPANGTQAVRIQYVGDPSLPRGQHYFVTIAQLPVDMPEGESGVQLLYNFQVVVGVNPTKVRPAIAIEQASIITDTGDGKPRLALTLTNASAAYGYLSGGSLRIVQRDTAGATIFERTLSPEQVTQEIGYGLVGPGQTRRITTPMILPAAGGSVDVRFTPIGR